jgi:hypothetical protein
MSRRRPTILIGHGRYGREVLQSFLAWTVTRDVLEWQTSTDGSDVSDRGLRDLRLVHVQAAPGVGPDEPEPGLAQTSALFLDVFRQICSVTAAELPDQCQTYARELLSKEEMGGDQAVGLDVILVAQISQDVVLGHLRKALTATFERLHDNPRLNWAGSNASRLCILQILDFDGFWDKSRNAESIRAHLGTYLAHWDRRYEQRRHSIARTWLVDRQGGRSSRKESQRRDEVVLFLEFLLLGDQRAEMQHLFTRSQPNEGQLGSFGIGIFERSSGLLTRLAAAYHGYHWLAHLVSATMPENHGVGSPGSYELEPQLLLDISRGRETLAQWCEQQLQAATVGERGSDMVRTRLASLERELIEIPLGDSDEWARRVDEVTDRNVVEIRRELAEQIRVQKQVFGRNVLEKLPREMRTLVSTWLNAEPAVPLGYLLRQVKAAEDALGRTRSAMQPEGGEGASLGADVPKGTLPSLPQGLPGSAAIHRRFVTYRDEQVDLRRTRRSWWFGFAAALAALLTPALTITLGYLPGNWSWSPPVLAVLSLVVFLLLGLFGAQRALELRSARAYAFWEHTEKGRFADHIRRVLGPDGAIGAGLEARVHATTELYREHVAQELLGELQRIARPLRARQKEASWLRGQLRLFLQRHGISPDDDPSRFLGIKGRSSSVRHTTDDVSTLRKLIAQMPREPDSFAALQVKERPFEDWEERFHERFLFPLAFLDRLGRQFQIDDAMAQGGTMTLEDQSAFQGFLEQHSNLESSFFWGMETPPGAMRYAFIHRSWLNDASLAQTLHDRSYERIHSDAKVDLDRTWLLQISSGVQVSSLEVAS